LQSQISLAKQIAHSHGASYKIITNGDLSDDAKDYLINTLKVDVEITG
jgi:hypothetical protein